MFKLLRFLIPLALVIGIIYFLMAYQVVRVHDGFRVIKKDEIAFSTPLLDTRNWKMSDYLKNPEIMEKLGELKLEEVTDAISDSWQSFRRSLDKWVKEIETNDLTESARKDFDKLNKAIKEKYSDLDKQYRNGDINLDSFKKKLGQLRDWADQQWTAFRQKNLKE